MKIRKLKRLRQETSGRGSKSSFRVTTEKWRSSNSMTKGHARVWIAAGNFWR